MARSREGHPPHPLVASASVGRRRLLILLVITALVLLTFDQRGNRVVDGVRSAFITVTSPLRSVARIVATPIENAWNGVTGFDDLKQENDELRDRIEAQDGAAIAAEAVVYENQELKSELGLPTLSGIDRVKAEVISGGPSNFDQTITINQGKRKGIAVGMPVITSGGLVGRIEQVTDRQAVVRLLSDPESTVGVRSRRWTRARPRPRPQPRRRNRCRPRPHRPPRSAARTPSWDGSGAGARAVRWRWSRSTPRPASAWATA